ncbi:hypothetical protein PL11201_410006 [Planktothrix sp. PCC 11201]|nr:hypothetical protein PL11201_410006 [Planktothrix sp. PCC 11201]
MSINQSSLDKTLFKKPESNSNYLPANQSSLDKTLFKKPESNSNYLPANQSSLDKTLFKKPESNSKILAKTSSSIISCPIPLFWIDGTIGAFNRFKGRKLSQIAKLTKEG